jgi:CHAD domain-containing protein
MDRAVPERMAMLMPPDEAQIGHDLNRTADDRNGADGSTSTITVPRLRPRAPVMQAVVISLQTALSRIRSTEAEARHGDVEGIHRLRTTTRRLRSELRAFRGLVDPDWIGPLEGEMKWLAGPLGSVRDLDVLMERFRKAAAALELSETEDLSLLFADLKARHARGSRNLRAALQGERYRDLLAGLQRAIDRPAMGVEACTPCRTALPPLAAAAWDRLKKDARGLRPSNPDEAFHEVRKRAKRARYTAEMVAPVLSGSDAKGARRFIRGATRVQDTLGEHQDAVVACNELAGLLARHGGGSDFERAARRLMEGQAEAARAAREAFFDVWDKLDRKKSPRWLKVAAKVGR